jgi:hypothetical protein
MYGCVILYKKTLLDECWKTFAYTNKCDIACLGKNADFFSHDFLNKNFVRFKNIYSYVNITRISSAITDSNTLPEHFINIK